MNPCPQGLKSGDLIVSVHLWPLSLTLLDGQSCVNYLNRGELWLFSVWPCHWFSWCMVPMIRWVHRPRRALLDHLALRPQKSIHRGCWCLQWALGVLGNDDQDWTFHHNCNKDPSFDVQWSHPLWVIFLALVDLGLLMNFLVACLERLREPLKEGVVALVVREKRQWTKSLSP